MPERLVVLAPNWLGDVVMAEPAVAAIRRSNPAAHVSVAARASVAGVLAFMDGLDAVLPFPAGASAGAHARLLAAGRFGRAVLLPNSFRSAWVVRRAGIPARGGFRADGRSWLLTDRVDRPAGMTQVEYYLALTTALGYPALSRVPRLSLTPAASAAAAAALRAHGCDLSASFVVLAPGAAFGRAKQWEPAHVARLVERLLERGEQPVLVGAPADRDTAARVMAALPAGAAGRVVSLVGETDLDALAGVLAAARAVVANDSGALHLAAAFGTPVAAVFGPTDERLTAPTPHDPARAAVLTHQVWCRPCGLRECPIDHACMKGVAPERVLEAIGAWL